MLLLMGMSVASWTIIFKKTAILRGVRRDTERFERDFWSGGDLGTLLEAAQRNSRSDAVLDIFARSSGISGEPVAVHVHHAVYAGDVDVPRRLR
jgi:biopolymer transport protein ExbB/TolQ